MIEHRGCEATWCPGRSECQPACRRLIAPDGRRDRIRAEHDADHVSSLDVAGSAEEHASILELGDDVETSLAAQEERDVTRLTGAERDAQGVERWQRR